MQNNAEIAKALAHALEEATEDMNTMTVNEFRPFVPLFKKDTDTSTPEYAELCDNWARKISLYHPVRVVKPGQEEPVIELAPMFTSVDALPPSPESAMVINKFNHALTVDHPLRTDKEEAMFMVSSMLTKAQDQARVNNDIKTFAEIAEASGFKPDDIDSGDNGVEDMQWE